MGIALRWTAASAALLRSVKEDALERHAACDPDAADSQLSRRSTHPQAMRVRALPATNIALLTIRTKSDPMVPNRGGGRRLGAPASIGTRRAGISPARQGASRRELDRA